MGRACAHAPSFNGDVSMWDVHVQEGSKEYPPNVPAKAKLTDSVAKPDVKVTHSFSELTHSPTHPLSSFTHLLIHMHTCVQPR